MMQWSHIRTRDQDLEREIQSEKAAITPMTVPVNANLAP